MSFKAQAQYLRDEKCITRKSLLVLSQDGYEDDEAQEGEGGEYADYDDGEGEEGQVNEELLEYRRAAAG